MAFSTGILSRPYRCLQGTAPTIVCRRPSGAFPATSCLPSRLTTVEAPLQADKAGVCNWLIDHAGFTRSEAESVHKQCTTVADHPVTHQRFDETRVAANWCCMRQLYSEDDFKTLIMAYPLLLRSKISEWNGVWSAYHPGQQTVCKLIKEHGVALTRHDPLNAMANLALMKTYGLKDADARERVFRQCPELLFLDYRMQFIPAVQRLRRSFKETITSERPQIHADDLEDQADRVMRARISENPSLLTNFVMFQADSPANLRMEDQVEYLKELGMDGAAVGRVIMGYPNFSKDGIMKSLKPKLKHLVSMGCDGPLLSKLLGDCPQLLQVSKKELERRWKFLRMVVGASVAEVADAPHILLLNVYKDLGPAYHYYSCLNEVEQPQVTQSNGRVDLRYLVAFASGKKAGRPSGAGCTGMLPAPIPPAPAFFDHACFERARVDWQSGVGQGWRDTSQASRELSNGSWR